MRFQTLCIRQPSGRDVFSFAVTADILLRLTDVPHIGRGETGDLIGYQRPEVAAHILEIRRYLDSDQAILPNTIVIAFTEAAHFEASESAADGVALRGELHVPEPEKGAPRPGFVVDGQQRLAAIAGSKHEHFPFFVTAFIAPNIAEQRKQFILVNRAKPLPQGMIYELLPDLDGMLPQNLARQRYAAQLTARLNLDPASILYHKIRTPTCPQGVIKDNSMRRALLNSINDGALLAVSRSKRGESDLLDTLAQTVETFWRGVASVFKEAWNLPPKQSRLTHGVGVVAFGYVMDHLYARCAEPSLWTEVWIAAELAPLAPRCAWTQGTWNLNSDDSRAWNALQNTDRDVRILTAFFRNLLNAQNK